MTSVGDRVRAVLDERELRGIVRKISDRGPVRPDRTTQVELDEPLAGRYRYAWFRPADLHAE